MTLKQRLDQRQVQKLILAPALQQAIKLLPLTNLELIEVIDEELSQNPMIEIEDEAREGRAQRQRDRGRRGGRGREQGQRPRRAEPRVDRAEDGRRRRDNFLAGFQEYLDEGFRPHFTREPRGRLPREHAVPDALPLGPSQLAGLADLLRPEDRELATRHHREHQRDRLPRRRASRSWPA